MKEWTLENRISLKIKDMKLVEMKMYSMYHLTDVHELPTVFQGCDCLHCAKEMVFNTQEGSSTVSVATCFCGYILVWGIYKG